MTPPPPPPPQSVRYISDCLVKPRRLPPHSDHPLHLAPWELAMLSVHYIQKGLLFPLPPHCLDPGFDRSAFIHSFLEKLKRSLSSTLSHFYPLAGRLATLRQTDPPFHTVFVDCANSPGARFIHAALDITVADILSPTYVPSVVQSFFDHNWAVNHDGHALSLLSAQVTELADGVFIGLSMNHVIGDGTSFWLFFNSWSEIFQAQEKGGVDVVQLSCPPVLTRWFPENHPGPISLPYADDPSSFQARYEVPDLRERVFHFSADAIAGLKAEANRQCGTTKISSFQSLTALAGPPLPPLYFGNPVTLLRAATTVGELLGGGLGWVALLLHAVVAEHGDAKLREWNEEWIERPQLYRLDKALDRCSIVMASSPRFNMYGNDFGLGKALAPRSGCANKTDGKVSSYPGREGGGNVDLEICLSPATMAALEADAEFMAAALMDL
ncbi:hypothetical protein NL676_024908 [Syzygium grande]|nr:hypothetical protein NL676_024908 [Syzygium grande]